MMLKVGFVGWRGMVGSVLMQRMLEENDFVDIEPQFFTTSQVGGVAPNVGKDSAALKDASNINDLRTMDVIVTCQGGDYTSDIFPKLRQSGWQGHWIDAIGRPIVAPSANRSGRVSPTTAQHVADDFRNEKLTIIDGGPATGGLESTIVRVGPDAIWLLRPGMLARGDIEAVAGLPVVELAEGNSDRPLSPGQLASHYAPRAILRLNAAEPEPGEAYLAFGNAPKAHAGPVFDLSPRESLIEAATRLFAGLRELDATGAGTIAVAPIPNRGLGEAINDRLLRAASPRS